MKKINIGISIALNENISIWNNGLNQNLAFLVLLFRKMPQVGKIFLLNSGNIETLPSGLEFDALNVPLVMPQDVTFDIDLVIEMGSSMPVEWLRHVRALGARIVSFFVGHSYPAQAEVPIFERSGGPAFVGTPWHEIWTLPQYAKSSVPLLRTAGRVPVHTMPHVWSPMFLARQVANLEGAGHRFGFKPRTGPDAAWRLAIFEPNISVAKTCFIPMLACDSAYRANRNAVGLMMVMNTFHMKEHLTFNRLASHLDLTRDSKASYEPRIAFAECMAVSKIDAVVAHQWENAQNYLYYDALYGGYPLIHNSDFLKAAGMGFYYPGFQAIKGGQALLEAWGKETGYWTDYRNRCSAYLQTVAPQDPANVQAFSDRITSLMEATP